MFSIVAYYSSFPSSFDYWSVVSLALASYCCYIDPSIGGASLASSLTSSIFAVIVSLFISLSSDINECSSKLKNCSCSSSHVTYVKSSSNNSRSCAVNSIASSCSFLS